MLDLKKHTGPYERLKIDSTRENANSVSTGTEGRLYNPAKPVKFEFRQECEYWQKSTEIAWSVRIVDARSRYFP